MIPPLTSKRSTNNSVSAIIVRLFQTSLVLNQSIIAILYTSSGLRPIYLTSNFKSEMKLKYLAWLAACTKSCCLAAAAVATDFRWMDIFYSMYVPEDQKKKKPPHRAQAIGSKKWTPFQKQAQPILHPRSSRYHYSYHIWQGTPGKILRHRWTIIERQDRW